MCDISLQLQTYPRRQKSDFDRKITGYAIVEQPPHTPSGAGETVAPDSL